MVAFFCASGGYSIISQGLENTFNMHSDNTVNEPRLKALRDTVAPISPVNEDRTDRSLFVSIMIFLAFLTPFLVWFFAVNP